MDAKNSLLDYQTKIKELEQENILLRKQSLDIASVFGEVMEKIFYPLVLTKKRRRDKTL
ncbi:MAG: hypothetical protein RR363_02500 [Rikenellaceae bacterium]